MKKQRRKLTPKQRVLKKHPGAWLWLQPQELYVVMPKVYVNVDDALGCGETPREAWANAASEPKVRRADRTGADRG